MKLTQVIADNLEVPINGMDAELTKEVQNRLAALGCLDPPADGLFGPVSKLSVRELAKTINVPFEDIIDAAFANVLLDNTADTLFPLTLSNDFASRILKYMQLKGFWFCRMPKYLTIVYVEGANEDGTPNANTFNAFNDRRAVLTIQDGKPRLLYNVLATTEPGRFFTIHPQNPGGAARIAFGQYKAWHVGIHKAGRPSAHEALTQAADLPLHRDLDANGLRAGDRIDTGMFGINQHSGFNADPNNIGQASAGCLVARSHEDHRAFMLLVKSDPRFSKASSGYRFMSTVIAGDDLQSQIG
jgi:hypothetical protein